MSVVAGLVHAGRIYLGADSAVVRGDEIETVVRPKVRRRSGMLIGACGDMPAVTTILDTLLLPYYPGGPLDEWLATILAPSIAEHTKKEDYSLMVGVAGRLAVIDSDGTCVVHAQNYAAIGTGGPYALGALCSWRRFGPRLRVRRAVEAAIAHCSSVRGPTRVLSL